MTVVRTQGREEMGVAPRPDWVEQAMPRPARMTPRAKSAARRRRSKTSFSTGEEASTKGSFFMRAHIIPYFLEECKWRG